MPTGYTAKLMESGESFPDFVLRCARAFGACVTMRDDPVDAQIPEKFEPSDYHVKRVAEAKAELSRLEAMSNQDRIAFGSANKSSAVLSSQKWLETETQQNHRLEEMESKVQAWTAPSPDHEELKKFMVAQIALSKNRLDYIRESIASSQTKDPLDYYASAVSSAQRDIVYHTEEQAKELERANSRTDWVRKLRASL